MKPLLLIHGTGVRRSAYDRTLAIVRQQTHSYLPGYEVKECYWGEPYGSLPWVASIPVDPNQDEIEEAEQIALWQRLLEDPFYELRLIQFIPESEEAIGLGESAGEILWQKLNNLKLPDEAWAILDNNDLIAFWVPSLDRLIRETERGSLVPRWRRVVESAGDRTGDMRFAIAHCLIAQMMIQARNFWQLPIDSADRERLKDLIVDELGGVDKGLGTLFANVLFGAAILLANPGIRADRGDFSTETGPAIGDTLLYQTRGEEMRGFIQKRIEQESVAGPVLIVAHSLGALACFDLLVHKNLWQNVKALVTVGAQIPYLYEIGALWSLDRKRGATLPDYFPRGRWLNVMNRWDFLSYPAERVFPNHARDCEVSGLAPFPLSHSAYWKNRDTWPAIRKFAI